MELLAAVKALEFVPEDAPLTIVSDSEYVVKGATEWLPGWKRKGWRNSQGKKVANLARWKRLDRALSARAAPAKFEWVRGHAGNALNILADKIATQEARRRRQESIGSRET
jgi:ribonuclease HI